jgi:hypothetical protein
MTPRWHFLRLRTEHQEHLGCDELELLIAPKLKCCMDNAAILVGLAR